MKKEIKKKEVKKVSKNPFATIFKQFVDYSIQKFADYYEKMNNNQILFTIREDIEKPIRIIIYFDKDTNVYNLYIRINNVVNSFYLSDMSVQQDMYIYDNKKVLEQTVVKCLFVKGKTTTDLIRNAYDKIQTNINNIIEFFNTIK
jgi:hypothetical protein